MNELEIYKSALKKISMYAIEPTGESQIQRIKRLKNVAEKALYRGGLKCHSQKVEPK